MQTDTMDAKTLRSQLSQALLYIKELEDKLDRAIVPDLSLNRIYRMRATWPELQPGAVKLLLVLYDAKGVVEKSDLETAVPAVNHQYERTSDKVADVWVCRARKIMGPDVVRTAWGSGYELTPNGRALIAKALA